MNNLVNRFLSYVKIDTQSDEKSTSIPSTLKQFDLANALVNELKNLGLEDVSLSKECVVYGRLKANTDKVIDKVAFIAHMDTSPDLTGKNVNPRIIKNYDGSEIVLNKELNIVLDPENFECLKKDVGSDLVVTDGLTLLGADDKAGIAEIMTMLEYFITHKDIPHGEIVVVFNPDEEVGIGADNIDIEKLAVDYAYTVDGGYSNCIEYENFNASSAKVILHGLSIHPGSAKHKMINSQLLAMEFHNLLRVFDNPMYTEGYEGFNHLVEMQGNCELTTMEYIIRNHDKELLIRQENDFKLAQNFINSKYGVNSCELELSHSYSNMREYIENKFEIVQQVMDVMTEMGLEPKAGAIRGGTDGANLTYRGLLCPNIGTGGRNYHGKYEYASIKEMEEVTNILINLVKKISSK